MKLVIFEEDQNSFHDFLMAFGTGLNVLSDVRKKQSWIDHIIAMNNGYWSWV
jgi:hypothetical protein